MNDSHIWSGQSTQNSPTLTDVETISTPRKLKVDKSNMGHTIKQSREYKLETCKSVNTAVHAILPNMISHCVGSP